MGSTKALVIESAFNLVTQYLKSRVGSFYRKTSIISCHKHVLIIEHRRNHSHEGTKKKKELIKVK